RLEMRESLQQRALVPAASPRSVLAPWSTRIGFCGTQAIAPTQGANRLPVARLSRPRTSSIVALDSPGESRSARPPKGKEQNVMLRIISGVLVAATLALPAAATGPGRDHARRHPKVVWHGYGFLPGYRPPEQIEHDKPPAPTGHYFYGYPGYNF